MKKIMVFAGVLLALCIALMRYNSNHQVKSQQTMEQTVSTMVPEAGTWVNSPLRNRLQVKLNAPVHDVWTLVGDPANMPQYSGGLRTVINESDDMGKLTGYTCYFNPVEDGQPEITHFSSIVWHEKNLGWASRDDDHNAFGTLQSLSLMTLQKEGDHTIFRWDFHFNCADEETLNMNKEGYRHALDDIAGRLINRFGGDLVENYVEGL